MPQATSAFAIVCGCWIAQHPRPTIVTFQRYVPAQPRRSDDSVSGAHKERSGSENNDLYAIKTNVKSRK